MNPYYFADNIDVTAFGRSPEDGPFGVYYFANNIDVTAFGRSPEGPEYPLIRGPFNTYEEADAVADELNDASN